MRTGKKNLKRNRRKKQYENYSKDALQSTGKNGYTFIKCMKMGFLATYKDFLQNRTEILRRFVCKRDTI
jgi:hypothetical protein